MKIRNLILAAACFSVLPSAPVRPAVSLRETFDDKAPTTVKALREEYATLLAEAETFGAKESPTPEEVTADTQRFARLDAIKVKLDRSDKLAGLAFARGAVVKVKEPEGSKVGDSVEFSTLDFSKADSREAFGKAATQWAASGVMDERFATITTATSSGLFLPKSVLAPVVPFAANAFRQGYAAYGMPVMDTTGDTSSFNLPVLDSTTGGQVSESASSETDGTPTFANSITSICKTYQSGSVYYSAMQLSATKFDLLGATIPVLDFSKELGLESTIAAGMIADAGITQTVTTPSTTTLSFGNIATWCNALPKRYQSLRVNLLSPTAYALAEGLVNSQGTPIFLPDAQNGDLKRLLGVPTFRCDFLQAMGTATHIVGYQFSLMGFHLRDAGVGITRYTQVPAKPNQIGINEFAYHAYGYSPAAVVALIN